MQETDRSLQSNNVERSATAWRRRAFIAWALIGAAILVYVLGYVLNVLAIPVGIVIWTAIIVFCLRGTVNRLQRRGVSRSWGTTIAYVAMILVITLIVLLMSSPLFGIGDQFKDLAESVPAYVDRISNYINGIYAQYPDIMQNPTVIQWVNDATTGMRTWLDGIVQNLAAGLATTVSLTANTFLCIGFALVVAFWLLMDLPSIGAECTRLLGTKHEEDIHFLHITFSRVMDGYIKGTLLQCALIALGCIIAFSILGVPNAIALGIITGLLNIIPVIGPWFGGAAAALAALFVSPFVALLALIITIAIQQFVYTFISPKIMANSVDVHPVLVVFAMMIGYAIGMTMSGLVGSLVGMLLSIPAAAVGKAIFVYYFEKHTGRHLIAEDGVFFKGVPSAGDAPNPEADATSPHPQMLAARIKAEAREAARKAEGAATRMRGHSGHEHEDAPPAAKKK